MITIAIVALLVGGLAAAAGYIAGRDAGRIASEVDRILDDERLATHFYMKGRWFPNEEAGDWGVDDAGCIIPLFDGEEYAPARDAVELPAGSRPFACGDPSRSSYAVWNLRTNCTASPLYSNIADAREALSRLEPSSPVNTFMVLSAPTALLIPSRTITGQLVGAA